MNKNDFKNSFIDNFPVNGDVLMRLLKGHLLIEEVVREIYKLHLSEPNELKECKIDCHMAICLAAALTPKNERLDWVWSAAKKLNNIRNKLAHNLELSGLRHRVEHFINYVQSESNQIGSKPKVLDCEYPLLYDSIITLHVSLVAIRDINIGECANT